MQTVHSTRLSCWLQCNDRGRAEVLSQLTGEISSLTSCAEVRLQEAGAATPSGCAPAVIDDSTTVQLLLAGILDPQKEMEKLQKEKVRYACNDPHALCCVQGLCCITCMAYAGYRILFMS